MLNDIREQPEIIDRLIKKYLPDNQPVQDININIGDISELSNIYIVASGSSRNAGNIARYFIENAVKVPVIVDYASEFAHRDPHISKNDLFIAISQSGETADTFSALKIAVDKGAHTLAITNNPESKIYNLAESKIQVGAGKEKSIPATKSFMAQLIILFILAIYLAEKKNTLSSEKIADLKKELHLLSGKTQDLIDNNADISRVAEKIKDYKSLILLGRGPNHAAAQEGALKIQETCYIYANGFPSGEFMHGYIAVVDEYIPVISIILPGGDNYNLAINNTEEVRKKRNPLLAIIKSQEDKEIESRPLFSEADFINIPPSCEEISPVLSVICFQLLSSKVAELLGRDVNNPRSLTKAITSE